jgi:hypothetical protein
MRIWDVNPGYLNRQSLLGEHRELHGIVSILVNGKKGYANHPETVRWIGYGWALRQRHQLLATEMALRGYTDRTPVETCDNKSQWPQTYIDLPLQQFHILAEKYRDKEPGRIPLPQSAQQIWSQHKYSVLARDPAIYQQLGREVSTMKPANDFSKLAQQLTELLMQQPSSGGLKNALQHMWGYVSDCQPVSGSEIAFWTLDTLMNEVQQRTLLSKEPYLMTSTALGELRAWL